MRVPAAVVAIMIGGCATAGPGGEQPLTEIARGQHSGQTEARSELVTDQATFERLWRLNPGRFGLPAIDFGAQSVIAAWLGQRPTGGYSIEVERVVRDGDTLHVELVEHAPGPGCMTTQALTQPFHIVAVPAGAGRAEFTRRTVTVRCE